MQLAGVALALPNPAEEVSCSLDGYLIDAVWVCLLCPLICLLPAIQTLLRSKGTMAELVN